MRLNHLDLLVRDVPSTAAFFERYFGLAIRSRKDSSAIVILDDGHDFVLVLQRATPDDGRYPKGFHLGFLVDDVDAVHALHARFVEDAVPVSDVIVNARGTMIYVTAPEGYHVEVSCQRSRPAG